jgi:hypothetical protein
MSQLSPSLAEAIAALKAKNNKLDIAEAGLSEAKNELRKAKANKLSPEELADLKLEVAEANVKVTELKLEIANATWDVAYAENPQNQTRLDSLQNDINLKRTAYAQALAGQLIHSVLLCTTWLNSNAWIVDCYSYACHGVKYCAYKESPACSRTCLIL